MSINQPVGALTLEGSIWRGIGGSISRGIQGSVCRGIRGSVYVDFALMQGLFPNIKGIDQ